MGLGAFTNIEDLKELADANGIEVPRLRGLRLVSEEELVNSEEIAEIKSYTAVEEFKNSMNGIYTTSVDLSTIDEAPMAYKSMGVIKKDIADTATIIENIKPIYNFKASLIDNLTFL